MKLFFRRYVLVLLLCLVTYSIMFLFKENNVEYFNNSLILCLLYSLLIRLFDDYCDYEKDVKNNKVLFNKKILFLLIIISSVITIFLTVFTKCYLFSLMIIVLLASLIKDRLVKWIKVLYLPLLCFNVIYYCFGFNIINIIIIFVFTLVDIVLLIKNK